MSAFLGRIHYWLYNKIQLHEDILDEVIRCAESRQVPIDGLKAEAIAKFGGPERGQLEDVINHGNIHGWLQSKIQSVENRTAWIVTGLVEKYGIEVNDIAEIYRLNGKKAMAEVDGGDYTPKELYIKIFDKMLEGMPCDRVNEPVSESEEEFSWKTARCLHKERWDLANGDVAIYYQLRDAWIEGFIGENNIYTRSADGMNNIRRYR